MNRLRFLIVLIIIHAGIICPGNSLKAQQTVKTGTKAFTESVILGELIRQSMEADGIDAEIYKQLGGTRILWSALVRGEIDIYPDYTGTITEEILAERDIRSTNELTA